MKLKPISRKKVINYSEWENKTSNCVVNDIDEELLKNKIELGHSNGRMPYRYENKETVLSKLGILSEDKIHITNAGEVLFSKNKPVLLKLATFATDTKDTFIKLDHFYGNIYECIENGISYILSEINWEIIFDGGSNRKEIPEIPKEAIREIVVNAFGHAKYGSNTAFEIDVFKDRVSIYSPGFFPEGYTPEDFAIRHEEPVILNPKIINVLFKTCEIESFGYGFETTFKECSLRKIKFKYENTKSGFRFIFLRLHGQRNVQEKIGDFEIRLLKTLKTNPYLTINDLSHQFNKNYKLIYRSMSLLKRRGLIVREGSDKKGHWVVVNNGNSTAYQVSQNVQENVQSKMSKADIDVLNLIRNNKNITVNEISDKLKVGPKTIYRTIKHLKEKGYIKRIGTTFVGYWEILK